MSPTVDSNFQCVHLVHTEVILQRFSCLQLWSQNSTWFYMTLFYGALILITPIVTAYKFAVKSNLKIPNFTLLVYMSRRKLVLWR